MNTAPLVPMEYGSYGIGTTCQFCGQGHATKSESLACKRAIDIQTMRRIITEREVYSEAYTAQQ